jgi:hypothetical protein
VQRAAQRDLRLGVAPRVAPHPSADCGVRGVWIGQSGHLHGSGNHAGRSNDEA